MLAQRRLGLCSAGATPNSPQLLPAPARNMGRRLQQAYTLMWRLQLSEGWHMLKVTEILCPGKDHGSSWLGIGLFHSVLAAETNTLDKI